MIRQFDEQDMIRKAKGKIQESFGKKGLQTISAIGISDFELKDAEVQLDEDVDGNALYTVEGDKKLEAMVYVFHGKGSTSMEITLTVYVSVSEYDKFDAEYLVEKGLEGIERELSEGNKNRLYNLGGGVYKEGDGVQVVIGDYQTKKLWNAVNKIRDQKEKEVYVYRLWTRDSFSKGKGRDVANRLVQMSDELKGMGWKQMVDGHPIYKLKLENNVRVVAGVSFAEIVRGDGQRIKLYRLEDGDSVLDALKVAQKFNLRQLQPFLHAMDLRRKVG